MKIEWSRYKRPSKKIDAIGSLVALKQTSKSTIIDKLSRIINGYHSIKKRQKIVQGSKSVGHLKSEEERLSSSL